MATTKISKKQLPSDVVYATDLGDQISEHNLSPTAHQDIRNSLSTATILPSYNSTTHKITFTTIGGNTYEIDLPIEDAVDNVSYNSSTHIITVHKLDGTSSTIDLSGLINTYTGGTNAEVTVAIDANNEITASINAIAASKISYSNTSSGLSGTTTQAAIDELASEKVDKVIGKQLSTEDYTTVEKTKLSGIENNAEVNVIEGVKVNGISLIPDTNKDVDVTVPTKVSDLTNDSGFIDKDVNNLTNYTTTTDLTTALNNKVDKVNGKQLSTEDYTTAEKTKLAGLENYDDTQIKADLANKVDKVNGKGLSTEDYTTAEKNKLSGIENNAEVNTIETVKVNGTALTPDVDKAVDITIPAASEYTIEEVSATTGYAKSYQLKKDNAFIGAKIDIPKDLIITSGEVKTVDTPDVPYEGAQVGDLYIDLALNDPNAQHIYIPANALVDAYTGGNGIDISNSNVVSAKIDNLNANGLSVSANGIALTAATTSTPGAMSATDKTKLDTIESNADVNTIEIVKVNGTSLTPDANKAVDVTVPTQVSDLANDSGFIDKDVNNLTNYTKTSNLATVATSGSYNDLSDQPTIPTVNNATLTIQKNSTTIDTFTANASVDKTINISVPTKTSDLTNDDNVVKDASYVHTDNNYTDSEKNKLAGIETGAEVNIIETIKVNGTALTPDQDRAVDITVAGDASNISYDNTTSGLTADDVQEAIDELADEKVDKVSGKGLSTEDYTTNEKNKLAGIEASADVNTIESISVNNSAITPDANKNVDITVPTKVSDLNNDSGFITGISSTDVTTALGFTPMDSALKGANSGVAELDATGKVPSSQLPSYVDDVIEVDDYASLPATGETGKIYITKDTNKTYRWSGSAYVEISESLALGETSSTAYRGDRGKTAYDHSQTAHAPSNAEHNTIETISLNGTNITPDANRNVALANVAIDANYVHTDNNYTSNEKTKLSDIAAGAQVNTIEIIKVNGSALTPDVNKAVDITINTNQYETMPTASSALEGQIAQYIGTTTTTAPIYTNGYFYKCVESSETTGTYIWENIDVMDVSEYVTAETIQGQVSISAIPVTPLPGSVTETMLDSNVQAKLNDGGVTDYTELTNKPSINNTTLSGNKTSYDLGIPVVQVGSSFSGTPKEGDILITL